MEKFELDYKSLSNVVDPDTSRIPLKGNEHRIIRVAFDMVRFKDSGPEELWQVQSNDDGEFLVRTFDISNEENIVTSNWKVMLDKKEENITVAYQDVPIKRIACKQYGACDTKKAWMLRDTIYERLNNDQKFIKSFYFSLPCEKQAALKEIVAWKDFTAEEIKSILEQAGGSVEYRPTTHGFSYLVSFPNGYKLSVIPYGEGMGDVSLKDKPLEGERWDSVECMLKDAEGKDVNPNLLGVRHDGWGVFVIDISELAALAKRLATLEYGNLPSIEQPGGLWEEDEDENETEASDQWAVANQIIKLKKHSAWSFDKSGSGSDYQKYFRDKLKEKGKSLGDMDPEEKEEFFEGVDEDWKAENECGEWALAFLELELSKNAMGLKTCPKCGAPKNMCECPCPKCGMRRSECMCPKCPKCGGGPGECKCSKTASTVDFDLYKKAMCCEQGAEDKDEELLEKAYHALEHYLDPGSEEAVDLSSLIYDVEAGSGDPGMLRRMLEDIEEREEVSKEEPEEEFDEVQLVDEPEEIPLGFRKLVEEERLGPEEELSFEEEEDKKPSAERIDEILDHMRDIKHRLIKQDVPENEKRPLREKLNELKMELADIAESEFGTKKPTHLYHSKGFSKSEFLPTAEEYFEDLESDDE